MAATRKCQKYSELSTAYMFLPIAVETLGSMNDSACEFLEFSVAKYLTCSAIAEKCHFFFKDYQSLYRDVTRPCFMAL